MQLQDFVMCTISMTLSATVVAVDWTPGEWPTSHLPMVWVDGRARITDKPYIDTFFDRIVSISLRDTDSSESSSGFSATNDLDKMFENEATGVLITDELVLTSYNAFRKASMEDDTMVRLYVSVMHHRLFTAEGALRTYILYKKSKVVCGRHVVPWMKNEARPAHMKHGRHSPLHDLMVLRLSPKASLVEPVPPPMTNFDNIFERNLKRGQYVSSRDNITYEKLEFGGILTTLAGQKDKISEDMTFASIGHISTEHIVQSRYLELGEIYSDDNAVTNCEKWIPREWGYFICLWNRNNYAGIASGAMLFSDGKLFGIGAFMIAKGKRSILVFTDVRPYKSLLFKTCTVSDQYFNGTLRRDL